MAIVKIDSKKLEENEPHESEKPLSEKTIKIKRISEGYSIEGLPDYDVPVVAKSTSSLIDYLRKAGFSDEEIESKLSQIKAMAIGDTLEISLPEETESEESHLEVIRADIKSENVVLYVEIPRKLAKKLEETANMLDSTKRAIIIEALQKHLDAINDISYLDGFNLDDAYVRVDDFIKYLREKGIVILTPKAIKRIRQKLKGKWAITLGKDKFTEFCEKLGIDESETENPEYAFFVKWK